MNTVTEHSAKIIYNPPKKDVHRRMKIFYNPIMESNRNISILLLNSIQNKNMKISLPLAGSGVRGLRFLKELKKNKIKYLSVNDHKENFVDNFTKNLKLNKIKNEIRINNEDASLFLLKQEGFDYIDIDPFGSPNPFLQAAISRISRKGILAITATDTAALTGTYPKVTKRKYWATTQKNYLMHEIGLRLLIRKVQLQGVQFDKALIPILSYHKDHYFRAYFQSYKDKEKCNQIIKQHQYFLFNPQTLEFKTSNYNQESNFQFIGPLWSGKLFDKKLITKMAESNLFLEEQKFLNLLKKEAVMDLVGFYDLHVLAKKYKFEPPKLNLALNKLKGVRTHFSLNGIKTTENIREILKIIKKTRKI